MTKPLVQPLTMPDCLLRAAAAQNRGIVFVNSGEQEDYLSYRGLYDEALRCLGTLQQKGVQAGDEVVLQVSDNRSFLIVFWACLLGRIIPVPLSIGIQNEHKRKLLLVWGLLKRPWMVADSDQLLQITRYAEKEGETTWLSELEVKIIGTQHALDGGEPGIPVNSNIKDIAYLQFSSGSTGDPKGVVLTHENLFFNTFDISTRCHVTGNDNSLSWMPLTHDMGLICFHLTAVHKASGQVIIPTSLFIRRPLLWLDKATQHKATQLYSPNFGYEYLLNALDGRSVEWDLSGVRLIYNGAEPISYKTCQKFLAEMHQYGLSLQAMHPGYGLAEASVAVSLPDPGTPLTSYFLDRDQLNTGDKVQFQPGESNSAVQFTEVGYVLDNCRVRICGDDDRVLEDEYIGHIQIKGMNVTSGYYNLPALNKKIFTKDGWLHTGDLGFTSDKKLVITGRSKNLLILNGQNYYPQDIERMLEDIPGLETGKVVAASAQGNGGPEEMLVFALFKGNAGAFVPVAKSIIARLTERLGFAPGKIIAVTKIPKTTSGKIQQYHLVTRYLQGEFAVFIQELEDILHNDTIALSRARPEELICRLAEEITGGTIDMHNNPAATGMNSLQVMMFLNRWKKLTGHNITAFDFFSLGSFTQLAEMLQTAEVTQSELLPSVAAGSCTLSHAQQRMWVLCRMQDMSSSFHLATAARVKGKINIPALKKAIMAVLQRHQALRAVIRNGADGAVQQFIAPAELECPLKINEELIAEESIETIITREANKPFDENNILFRAVLTPVAEEDSLLQFTFHHLVFDGWSYGVFAKELDIFYSHFTSRKKIVLPPLHLYSDFVALEKEQLRGEQAKAGLDYWKNELKGALPELGLLRQFNNNRSGAHHGRVLSFSFPGQFAASLHEISAAASVTPFAVLMAALNIYYYKLTGQKDIIFGTEAAGRTRTEWEPMIGYFLNTLPVRTVLDEETTFGCLLQQVKEKLLTAYTHQQYPVNMVIDEMGIDAHSGSSRLFDILVLYQNFSHSLEMKSLGSLQITPVQVPEQTSITDLHLEFREENGTLHLHIRFDTDYYDELFVRRFFTQFEQLLQQVIAFPGNTIGSFSGITAQEKDIILNRFNQPPSPYAFEPVIHAIEEQAVGNGNKTAVICGNKRVSYTELLNEVARISACLAANGIGTGSRVAIMMQRSEQMIIALLAVLRTGGTYVPVEATYSDERIQFIINNSEAGWLLTDVEKSYAGNAKLLQWNALAAADNIPAGNYLHKTNEDDLAYILYTSGTTGHPKGVLIGHGSLSDYVQTFTDYFSVTAGDIIIQQSNLAFDTHVEEIFPALRCGATLVVMPEGGRNITQLADTLVKEQVTILSTTPLVIGELNRQPATLSSLRILISGGDELKMAYISNLPSALPIYNTYGPTESTVCASYQQVMEKEDCRYIGKPVKNRQIFIVNPANQLLPAGITGEIVIAGAGLAKGYQRLDEETAARFIQIEGQRAYKTGDMGRWTADGRIEFLGRKDDQVKIRGYRVELNEVEEALLQHPLINAVAVKVWGSEHNKYLAAYFVPSDDGIAEEALPSFLLSRIPEYMVPAQFIRMNALPVSANGKTDKKQLQEPAPVETGMPFSGEAEEAMAAAWKEIVQVDDIHPGANFFQCGGNSIKAAQIAGRLQQQGWNMLRMSDFFVYSTLRKLAAQLRREQTALLQKRQMEFYPLTHEQRRLWYIHQLQQSSAFNLCWAYRITGSLGQDAFYNALQAMVHRHENLRTVFVEREGEPYMNILPALPEWFQQVESAGAEQTDEEVLSVFTGHIFNLERGPLLKAALVRKNEHEHIFLLVIHHIITDGWSMQVFIKEFKELYNAALSNREAALEPVALRFHDYAVMKSDLLQKEVATEHKAFWQEELGTAVQPFALPVRALAVPGSEEKINQVQFNFSQGFAQCLHQMVRHENASLFTGILSVLNALTYKYTGHEELLIGTDTSDRQHTGLENAMGYFLSELVVRLNCTANGTFRELLGKVKQKLADVFSHAQYPYDKNISIAGSAPGRPLFNMLVLLQNFDTKDEFETLHPALQVERITPQQQQNITDLQFEFFQPGNEELFVKARFDPALYDQRLVMQLLNDFETFGIQLLSAPDEAIGSSELLSAPAIEEWLVNRNATDVAYGDFIPVCQMIGQQAKSNPQRTAIVCGTTMLTYGELNSRANRIAHALLRQSGAQGGHIGLLMPRSEEFFVALLAIMKAGKTYVPLDPELPSERLQYMATDSRLDAIITTGANEQYDWMQPFPVLDATTAGTNMPEHDPAVAISDNDTAYIIYTSGSTGRPKGVMIGHDSLTDYVITFACYFNITANDRVAQQASVSFDTMVEEAFPVLCAGGVLSVVTSGGKDVEALLGTIREQQVTILSTTPLVIAEINRLGLHAGTLRVLISGGDVLKATQVNNLLGKTAIYNTYGPSESTVCATYHKITSEHDVSVIGRPIANRSIYLLDINKKLVADGTTGEIYIGGKGLAKGYINREEENKIRFIENPYRAGERLYRTGDLAYINGDGDIQFTGRADDQFKLSGYRIEASEIENICLELSGIKEAFALLQQQEGNAVLVLYYTTFSGGENNNIHEWLAARLPAYMVPAGIMHLDKFPLNISGKIDRASLPAFKSNAQAGEHCATVMETMLSGIWKEILGVQAVNRNENFFTAGGNSLNGTRLVNEITKATGRKISLKELFAHPVLHRLARIAEQAPVTGMPQIIPAEEQAYYPVSYAQKRMWILHHLDDQSAAYNISFTSRLNIQIQPELLTEAFRLLVQRHDSLRTIFHELDNVPVQVILPAGDCIPRIHFTDISQQDTKEQEKLLNEIIHREAGISFSLVQWPLFRATLLNRGKDTAQFIFSIHHSIADGVSVTVLMEELLLIYTALLSGQAITLSAPAYQYKEYVAAQQQRMASELLKKQEAYWLSVFEGDLPVLEIPGCLNRPAARTYRGATHSFIIPAEQVNGLKNIMAQHDATLFMALFASVSAMLYRYTCQNDMVIGTPVAGRNEAGLESLIGLFVNTLPLRIAVAEGDSFTDLIKTVRHTAIDAYTCQDYPFDLLVDKLNLQRNLSRSPLFDVMVVLPDGAMGAKQTRKDIYSDYKYINSESSKFDLNFDFEEQASGLEVRIQFSRDIFSDEAMQRFVHCYRHLLEQCIITPGQPLNKISYIPQEDQASILSFNPQPVQRPVRNVIRLLEEQAEAHPARHVIRFNDTVLSYEMFNGQVNRFAHYLKKEHGLNTGDLIGVMLPRSEQLIITIWAIIKAGCVYVPIDPAYPEARKNYLVEDSGIRLLVTDNHDSGFNISCPVCDINTIALEQYSTQNPGWYPAGNDAVYAIYTSGTTGNPKGVITEYSALQNLVNWLGETIYDKQKETLACLLTASVNFDASVQQLFAPLVFGHTLIVISEQTRRDVQLYADVLVREQVNVIDLTPSFLNVLLTELGAGKTPPVSYTLVGGEPLESRLVESYGEVFGTLSRLINVYGVTEAAVDSTFETAVAHRANTTIGKPLPNTQIFILDKHLQIVPVGVPGQICLAGAGLGRGYLNRPELTAGKFIYHEVAGQNTRLYLTGDTGKWLPDGTIEFIGRTDRQVKLRGYRIELGEIETTLLQHPQLKQVYIMLRNNALAAYYISAEKMETSLLAGFLQERLPSYMIPSVWIWLEKFPVTPSGKINEAALPVPEKITGTEHNAGSLPALLLQQVTSIWNEVLNLGNSNPGDNFFASGGHSLSAMMLASRLSKKTGASIRLQDIFMHQTIRELVRFIDKKEMAQNDTAPYEEQEHYPLSPAQEQMWIADQQGGGAAYLMPSLYEIEGGLNIAALEKACTQLVERHEILRTGFRTVNGMPRQYTREAKQFTIPVIEAEAQDTPVLIESFTSAPFNLEEDELLCIRLIRTGRNRFLLVFVLHHIISDGLSAGVIVKELIHLYYAHSKGTHHSLPARNRQYKDHVLEHAQWLLSDEAISCKNYWKRQLSGGTSSASLPADRIKGTSAEWAGEKLRLSLEKTYTEEITGFVAQQQITFNDYLLTCVFLVMQSFTGSSRFVLGVPVAGRNNKEMETQVGLYVNTLPVFAEASEAGTATSWLQSVHQSMQQALAHQQYPVHLLTEEGRSPFNILFLYQEEDNIPARMQAGDIIIQSLPVKEESAKYDITISFVKKPSGLTGHIKYRPSRYSTGRMELFKERLLHCCRELASGAGKTAGELFAIPAETRDTDMIIDINL